MKAIVVALAALTLAHVSAAAAPPTESTLVERLDQAEARMRAEKSAQARVRELKNLEGYLEQALAALPPRNKDDGMRKLRSSLWSLKAYLDKIDTDSFESSKCHEYRSLILLGFRPSGHSPDYVPGEAREALKLLSLVCAKPALAEIPAPSHEGQ